jgi:ankyrin repeat protein
LNILLAHGCDVHIRDGCNETALHYAARKGHILCLKRLIEAGSEVYYNYYRYDNKIYKFGNTVLHQAAKQGHIECVKILLDAGCDVNIINLQGLTVLHLASQNNHPECVKLFLEKNSYLNIQDTYGNTELHYATQYGKQCVKLLLDAGCNANISDKLGKTALHYASAEGDEPTVKLLLAAGCNVNSKDMIHNTSLYYAAERRRINSVKILLSYGAEEYKTIAQFLRSGRTLHDVIHYSEIIALLEDDAQIMKLRAERTQPIFNHLWKLSIETDENILSENHSSRALRYIASYLFGCDENDLFVI